MAQVLQLCDLVSVGKRHDLKNSSGPYHLFLWSDMVRCLFFHPHPLFFSFFVLFIFLLISFTPVSFRLIVVAYLLSFLHFRLFYLSE